MKKIKFDIDNLPQNVKLVGEKEEKDIYISQAAYKKIHNFTKNKLDNESGGLLIGSYIEAFNTTSVVIYDFIDAKYTEATKTTLTFTHKTWDYLNKEIENKYENAKIVGWIHTHPGFGIFLSDYDKFIQNNFFNGENQVAMVVDPIQIIEGFFTTINSNLIKCKGFYIFDDIGKDIDNPIKKEDIKDEKKNDLKTTKDKGTENKMNLWLIYIFIIISLLMNILNFMKTDKGLNLVYKNISDLQMGVSNAFNDLKFNIDINRNKIEDIIAKETESNSITQEFEIANKILNEEVNISSDSIIKK